MTKPKPDAQNRVWRYVVATDDGSAPCPYRGVLTLCICKPVIRKHASVGDWVIGFAPKRYGIGRVIWAGKVGKVLPMGQYAHRHPRRPDAIYRLIGHSADGSELLEHAEASNHHPLDEERRKDMRGTNCLVFRDFWYWGGEALVAPPAIAELAFYRQGQTTKGTTVDTIHQLQSWLHRCPPGVRGHPLHASRRCQKSAVARHGC